jgi:tetratricopeptide (TPR) repeat protein
LKERLRGLTGRQAGQLRQVMLDLARSDVLMAGQRLLELAQSAPDHPEVLRWRGARHAATGEWAAAVNCLSRSAERRPGDFEVLLALAQAQEQGGDHVAALHSLQAAQSAAHSAANGLALSIECDRQGRLDLALAAVDRALALEPQTPVALLQRARCRHALGQADGAAADCRALIATNQFVARAWFTLLDLKTVRLQAGELERLARAADALDASSVDRPFLDFALGKALEDAGQPERALAALHRANAAVRPQHPWDSAAFAHQVQAVRTAFAGALPGATQPQGAEVIFLVGLPRSGTTLVEQVLASHSRVEGASELPYLNQVVEEESQRRRLPFPAWVASTSPDDWARLGQRYLSLSAHWRLRRPVATDKLPENWLLAGAALAMLPQARVIDCRRDALETCWSCYKQLFGPQRVGFTYAFETLAAYWHSYDTLCRLWAQQQPQRFRAQSYEALVAEPEAQIRALLDFCGLPFEPACLHFHTAQRAIRTPSALQVRQPLKTASTPAAGYGALLDPLRRLLVPTAPA